MSTHKQTILIDFDGVLHDYHGWKGNEELGGPIEHARHALHILEKTYRLVVFTTRNAPIVKRWLEHYGFPEMKVTNIKEPAFLIIDDRALTFTGEWSEGFLTQIRNFVPHWEADLPTSQLGALDSESRSTEQPAPDSDHSAR